jgi:integrase
MGTVFRKTVTRPLPTGAELITRNGRTLARWKDTKGKTRTATAMTGASGEARIRVESGTFVAKFRNGDGLVVELPTGCRTEDAARQVLADLERRAERVRAGLISPAEARTAEHLAKPIGEHVAAYLTSLEASGASPKHVAESRRVLEAVLAGCGFPTLAAFDRATVEHWLNERRKAGTSARTRNIDLTRLIAFANWLIANGRLLTNPFNGIPKALESADTRRRRRAMPEAELVQLLDVARRRPLLEALTVRKGKRKGEAYANVRPEVRERLDLLGRERALMYKTLVLSGLRRNELASLTVAQLKLNATTPHVELEAADEKNREGNAVVIRPDLAADLRSWLDDMLARHQSEAREHGRPIPARLPGETRLFVVPEKLVRILNRDLKLAGIPKRDERGRTLDVHALRHTFGTLLSRGGVPLRTAQAAMRHGDPSLTANVYTDPKLLDVAGALDALPSLPLAGNPSERARATGTAGASRLFVAPSVAPNVAPTWCNGTQSGASPDNMAGSSLIGATSPGLFRNPEKKEPSVVMGNPDKARREWRRSGSNRQPPACKAGSPDFQESTPVEVTASPSGCCTARCTSEAENANADPLAAFVSSLTPEQRARLIALLASEGA